MVKLFKWHKYAGLFSGVILMLLGITGFLLNHDNWNFNYKVTFNTVPKSVLEHEKRLYETYYVDENIIYVGGRRGLFKSTDYGKNFSKELDLQITAIRKKENSLFLATNSGLFTLSSDKRVWRPFVLEASNITSMNIHEDKIIVAIDKKELVLIDINDEKIINRFEVNIEEKELKHNISLSRFVRDLHYARGLFDGISSLLINDYGAIVLTFLALLGYLIWFMLLRVKSIRAKTVKSTINFHANSFTVLAILPIIILAITGIFLDHAKLFRDFMTSVKIPYSILPPVYSTLKEDIWSVDFDGKNYRIGNRQGVYKSKNAEEWELESKGFAYRMIRNSETLFISGMGASNRIFKNGIFKILPKAPHMFKDVIYLPHKIAYLSAHKSSLAFPKLTDATLISVVLSLHDGTFFADWWVWINDIASILLIVLFITGIIRWIKRRRVISLRF